MSSDLKRWSDGPLGGVALVVLCLVVYLPGLFTISPIDRDESRFAQASRQMFESLALPEDQKTPVFHDGGLVIPKVQDRPRLNKPPLIYWLQAGSAWLWTGGNPLNDAIWMYRIPSVLSAMLAVFLTWRIGRSMFDPRAAWLGAALLAICPVVVFDAHQARADQLLLATVVGTQWGLWEVWKRHSPSRVAAHQRRGAAVWWWAAMFWVGMGLSVIAKGPIGPMIAALTVLALCLASRQWRWVLGLKPLLGILILAACIAPWVWMVGERVGWSNYLTMVYDETIGRSTAAKEGHWGPPGYHTVLLAVLFWPGSMMTALAVVRAWTIAFPAQAPVADVEHQTGRGIGRLKHILGALQRTRSPSRSRRPELFCLAWILPAWVVFEIVGTKLPHYTLPMYPAIALLSARMVLSMNPARAAATLTRLDRFGLGAWNVMGWFVCIAVAGLVLWCGVDGRNPPVVRILSLAGVVFTVFLGRLVIASRRKILTFELPQALAPMCLLAIMLWGVFFTLAAPRLLPGAVTSKLVAAINRHDGMHRPLASEYHEDSLIFATRGRVVRLNGDQMRAWLDGSKGGLAIISPWGGPLVGDSFDVASPYRRLETISSGWAFPDWYLIEKRGVAESVEEDGNPP